MAAQGTLTLNTKAYAPRGKTGDVAQWVLAGDTTFGGATSFVTTSVRGPSKDGLSRIRIKLDIPKSADAASACACPGQVIGTGLAELNIVVPAAYTAAERTDFRLRLQGLIANAITTALIDNLEGSW